MKQNKLIISILACLLIAIMSSALIVACDSATTNTNKISGNNIIKIDTIESRLLTNAKELNNVQFNLGIENDEPNVYPLVLDKAFVGWYYDAEFINKVEWPAVILENTTLYPKFLDGTSDLRYTFDSSSSTYFVDNYSSTQKNIIIADVHNDNSNGVAKVTKISNEAFFNNSTIISVYIPNSIIDIGESAFYNCSALTNVEVGKNLKSIGKFAFGACSKLTNLTLPNSAVNISDFAFYVCKSLKNINLSDGVTSIGARAFYNCSDLTSITIGSEISSIGEYAFYNCTNLSSVKFENTDGWSVAENSTATSGTSVTISATDLTANATLLTSTYVSKYWKRS